MIKVIGGTGGDNNVSATYAHVETAATIHASTNLTITTSGIFTQPFTSASSTNKVLGTVVYPVASWSGKTITFTLQENSVDTATTVVITGADVALNNYLRIEHTGFTQTSGRTYRYRISCNTSTCTIAQSATASQASAAIYNDQADGVPVSGDFVILTSKNANTDTTLNIVDTTFICGQNAAISGATAFGTSNRWFDMGMVFNGGTTGKANLTHASGTNTTMEFKNHVWQGFNGSYTCKPTAGNLATVNFTPGATAASSVAWFFSTGSLHDIQGAGLATPSYWKSKHVSGTGTAASPLIVNTPVDWTVGDYLVFHPTGNGATNYNETEYRYIITKNSSTSYVLSSTSGGSENALLYTHTGGYVFNDTAGKNVLWKSTDTNKYHIGFVNTAATTANSIFKWARVRDTYSSGSAARGSLAFSFGVPDVQYLTLGIPGTTGTSQLMYFGNNTNAMTLRGIFAYNCNPATSQDGVINTPGTASNKSFYDCHIIDVGSVGWKLQGANPYVNGCTAIACGKVGVPELYAGWNIQVNYGNFVDCEQHSNRLQGTLYYASSADVTWSRFISGTLGTNGDLAHQGSGQISYQTAYYDSATIADTNLMTGNLLLIEGSQIVFSNVNGTAYNNYKYTNNGSATVSGTGLTDTTLTPLGNRTWRLAPLTGVGIKYRYHQLASVNSNFLTYGKVWANSAFVSDPNTTIKVDLYLPGLVEGVDTPSDTVTMTKTTTSSSADAQYNLKAFYSGTRPRMCTIVVTAINPSATASAYAYIGDILNARNDTTAFNVMFEGQPADVMPETAGESGAISTAVIAQVPNAVWGDTSTYASNAKGGQVKTASKVKLLL